MTGFKVLMHLESHEQLNLSKRRIGNESIWHLLKAIENHEKSRVIQEANLSFNFLNEDIQFTKCLPTTFLVFSNIKVLRLSHNRFECFPCLDGLQLEVLDLSYNRISYFGDENLISLARTLKTLSLQGNRIQQIPESIGGFNQLETLTLGDDLAGNLVECLPSFLSSLKSLKELRVCRNVIRSVASEIYKLESAIVIDLAFNRICQMPIAFSATLKRLDLSYNQIKCIPGCIASALNQFEMIDISANLIQVIPESLTQFPEKIQLMLNPCYMDPTKAFKEIESHIADKPVNLTPQIPLKLLCQNALFKNSTGFAEIPRWLKGSELRNMCSSCPFRFASPPMGFIESCTFQSHYNVPKLAYSCSKSCALLKFQRSPDQTIILDPDNLFDLETN